MKKFSFSCALFLALYYSTNAIYQGYLSKFYQQQGISGIPLMLLLMSFPLMSLFALPVWGTTSDRMKKRRTALRAAIVLSAGFMFCFFRRSSIWLLLPLSCAFSACFSAIQPMGDSLILEKLQSRSQPFGPVRLFGCLAFAVTNLIAGWLLKDNYTFIPLIVAAQLLLLLLGTSLLPDYPGHQRSGEKLSFRQVLKLPHILPLIAFLVVLQLCMGYFYSYFSIYFTALTGGTSTLLGAAYFISAASEIPFLLFGHKFFKRWGAGRMMLFSAAAMAIRFALLGLTSSVAVALASQLLHGLGFIVMTVCTSQYVSLTAPKELKTSAQMLLSIVGLGIARVPGILLGGLISRVFGGEAGGFLLMSGLCVAAFCIFAPYFLRLKPLNGE